MNIDEPVMRTLRSACAACEDYHETTGQRSCVHDGLLAHVQRAFAASDLSEIAPTRVPGCKRHASRGGDAVYVELSLRGMILRGKYPTSQGKISPTLRPSSVCLALCTPRSFPNHAAARRSLLGSADLQVEQPVAMHRKCFPRDARLLATESGTPFQRARQYFRFPDGCAWLSVDEVSWHRSCSWSTPHSPLRRRQ